LTVNNATIPSSSDHRAGGSGTLVTFEKQRGVGRDRIVYLPGRMDHRKDRYRGVGRAAAGGVASRWRPSIIVANLQRYQTGVPRRVSVSIKAQRTMGA
jgi:hypothetical protein